MSATLDAKLFSNFYGGAPVINVPGRTFPIHSYYLEDVLEATSHIIDEDSLYSHRRYDNSQFTHIWVTSKGGEQRKETVSLDAGNEIELSDTYYDYSLSTRR